MKTPAIRTLAVSPGNTTSTSSSESDIREGNDDVSMTPYAQFHLKASNQPNSDPTGRSSRFKSPIEFSHHYSQFNRSDSPASRVSDISPSLFEADADASFLQQSKLSSSQPTCKSQVRYPICSHPAACRVFCMLILFATGAQAPGVVSFVDLTKVHAE